MLGFSKYLHIARASAERNSFIHSRSLDPHYGCPLSPVRVSQGSGEGYTGFPHNSKDNTNWHITVLTTYHCTYLNTSCVPDAMHLSSVNTQFIAYSLRYIRQSDCTLSTVKGSSRYRRCTQQTHLQSNPELAVLSARPRLQPAILLGLRGRGRHKRSRSYPVLRLR